MLEKCLNESLPHKITKKEKSRIPIVEEIVIPEWKRCYRFKKSGQIANTCICKHRGITENNFSEIKTSTCMCVSVSFFA